MVWLIEPRSPRPLVNTLLTRANELVYIYKTLYIYIYIQCIIQTNIFIFVVWNHSVICSVLSASHFIPVFDVSSYDYFAPNSSLLKQAQPCLNMESFLARKNRCEAEKHLALFLLWCLSSYILPVHIQELILGIELEKYVHPS